MSKKKKKENNEKPKKVRKPKKFRIKQAPKTKPGIYQVRTPHGVYQTKVHSRADARWLFNKAFGSGYTWIKDHVDDAKTIIPV